MRFGIRFILLSALLYVTFFVPVADRTIFEHLRRIAATKEAQELGSGLEDAAIRVKYEFTHAVSSVSLGNRIDRK